MEKVGGEEKEKRPAGARALTKNLSQPEICEVQFLKARSLSFTSDQSNSERLPENCRPVSDGNVTKLWDRGHEIMQYNRGKMNEHGGKGGDKEYRNISPLPSLKHGKPII